MNARRPRVDPSRSRHLPLGLNGLSTAEGDQAAAPYQPKRVVMMRGYRLVQYVRHRSLGRQDTLVSRIAMADAADEIESLMAEIARLRQTPPPC